MMRQTTRTIGSRIVIIRKRKLKEHTIPDPDKSDRKGRCNNDRYFDVYSNRTAERNFHEITCRTYGNELPGAAEGNM